MQRVQRGIAIALAVLIAAATVVLAAGGGRAVAQKALGRQDASARAGDDGETAAESWLIPSSDAATPSRALLYRPAGRGAFRLAVIAHASSENAPARALAPPPRYPGLTAWLVAQGYAVVIPERPGHGMTGGPYLEAQGGCDAADYARAARATADAIAAALGFMRDQPLIRKEGALVIGHSAGGLGALALAARNPSAVAAIVVFAPGRGGHAGDRPFSVCAEDRLVAIMRDLGVTARVPVTWLVADNDSYFPPALSRRMVEAFRAAGGRAEFRQLPSFGDEGHWFAERATAVQFDRVLGPLRGLLR